MWPIVKCKEAAASIVTMQDKALPSGDLVALRLHLLICKACPEFERQIHTMRKVMRAWQRFDDTPPDSPQ